MYLQLLVQKLFKFHPAIPYKFHFNWQQCNGIRNPCTL